MAWSIKHADLWAAEIEDAAGGLAAKLAGLAEAGAHLEFIFARRAPELPGKGIVFLTPLKGAKPIKAAKSFGFHPLSRCGVVRVEGPDSQGMGARITSLIAEKELTLRGFSATTMGKRCVIHLAFDSVADSSRAIRALRKLK